MTIRLFHQDSYLAEATARIVRKDFAEGRFLVTLDKTIFSPRGGGQPGDSGTMSGHPVIELVEADDEIIHILLEDPGQGDVTLKIDFNRRYDHMQQHTAQHLLSQYLQREMGIQTLSFQISDEHASIELSVENLTENQIRAVEEGCSRIVFENRPVNIFYTDDPSDVDLRKPHKKDGTLRIVEISGYDFSSCGGTHLRHTGEIGLIKIMRTDRVRGHLRVYYLSGLRALRDYQKKNALMADIQQWITLPPEEIPNAISKIICERDDLGREVKAFRRKELDGELDALAKNSELLIVRRFDAGGIDEMKYFTATLLKKGKNVFTYSPTLQYVQVGCGRGSVDLRKVSAEFFLMLSGKGGGRDSLIEGKATDFSKIEEVVAFLKKIFSA